MHNRLLLFLNTLQTVWKNIRIFLYFWENLAEELGSAVMHDHFFLKFFRKQIKKT